MRIEIRGKANAVIISFDTRSDRFSSPSERNQFFHGLYGWEQRVPGNARVYRYWRAGVLDDVPHMKISDSVFAVAMEHMKKVTEYFDGWEEKVEFEMFEVMMEMDKFLSQEQNRLRKSDVHE